MRFDVKAVCKKMRKVYLDTSVISALFDERTPERMAYTKQSWENILSCDVYISDAVKEELDFAEQSLADKFRSVVSGFTVLTIDERAMDLARIYVEQGIFPEKYYDDALHVAIASVNEIELLISWNFKHLVKIRTKRQVCAVNLVNDFCAVEIIAPPEL